jgi:hypothetical protein
LPVGSIGSGKSVEIAWWAALDSILVSFCPAESQPKLTQD